MWRAHHTWRNPPQLVRPTNARHSRICWDRTVKNYNDCGKRIIGGDIIEDMPVPDYCTPLVEFEDENYSENDATLSASSSTCSVDLQESYSYLDLDNSSETNIFHKMKNDGECETRVIGTTEKRIKRNKKDRLERGKKFSTYGRRCKAERIQMKRLNRIIDLEEKKERRRYRINCKYESDMLRKNENRSKFDEKPLTVKEKIIEIKKKRARMDKLDRNLNKYTELIRKPTKQYLDYKPDHNLYVEEINSTGKRTIREYEGKPCKIKKIRKQDKMSAKKELRRYEYESENFSVNSDDDYEEEELQINQSSCDTNTLPDQLGGSNANGIPVSNINYVLVEKKDDNKINHRSQSSMLNSTPSSSKIGEVKAEKKLKLRSKKRKTAGERSRVIQGKPRMTKRPPLFSYSSGQKDQNINNNNWYNTHRQFDNEKSRLENERFSMCCVM